MTGQLFADLSSIKTTPRYSFLTPDQCHDGHDACASNGNNQLAGADQFLKVVVPAIQASPAYKKDGLIVILFDEGTSDLVCCGEKKAPNLPSSADNGYPIPGPVADGGGQTGAILLSPRVTAGSVDAIHQFNHFSYLRSIEDLFGVSSGGSDGQGHLGYAGQPGLVTFQAAGDLPAG
jgi:phosphatidylinositol-3-phosphatase